uniref:Uncharacterized protein n=1 Tax=Rhizophora mucronata TaxID=61149 RepID=A0A2P2Q1Z4_RHIMU
MFQSSLKAKTCIDSKYLHIWCLII